MARRGVMTSRIKDPSGNGSVQVQVKWSHIDRGEVKAEHTETYNLDPNGVADEAAFIAIMDAKQAALEKADSLFDDLADLDDSEVTTKKVARPKEIVPR